MIGLSDDSERTRQGTRTLYKRKIEIYYDRQPESVRKTR